MKIKWKETFEVEVIDVFDQEWDNIEDFHNEVVIHNEVVKKDETANVKMINRKGDYVDLLFDNDSMVLSLHISTFEIESDICI
jgi:hypothetical protein